MARTPKFRVTETPRGWCVNVPATLSDSRRRERHYHKTRKAALATAKKFREEYRAHGEQAVAIGPVLAEQALRAEKILMPLGITLLDAITRFAEQEEAHRASVPVGEALEQYQVAKEHLSTQQVQAIRHMTTRLLEDFPGRQLASITHDELAAHIEAHTGGDGAFNTRRRLIVTFWRWAEKPPRRWCQSKVASEIETRSYTTEEIAFLTADQSRALMVAAEKNYPEAVPALAIALFTGMRGTELEALTPSDITSEGISVPKLQAKTKRRRFIAMTPTLEAWLNAYPVAETVCCSNWRRKFMAIRRLAGWKVWSNLVEPNTPPPDLPEWPNNGLRHTHATVAIATGATLEDLTFEFGHAGGAAVLKSHYVGAITKKEALAILAIGPKGKKVKLTRAA